VSLPKELGGQLGSRLSAADDDNLHR